MDAGKDFERRIATLIGIIDPIAESLSRAAIAMDDIGIAAWRRVVAAVEARLTVPTELAIILLEQSDHLPESAFVRDERWQEWIVDNVQWRLAWAAGESTVQ